jgi:hypothetical protein
MNYHILPKNIFNIRIKLSLDTSEINPCLSYSLIHHLNDVYNQLLKLESEHNEINIDFINKIVNPFEFIHTNVPGSLISVSKVKPDSNIFFELMEIFQICGINDFLITKNKINIANITPNYNSTNYLLNMIREDNEDSIINENFNFDNICSKFVKNPFISKIDLFIFEFNEMEYANVKQYLKNMTLVLYIIIKYQSNNGISIIKIDNIFYKTIIDILFIFSAIYDKIYLLKPSISKITKGERYIVCKHLNCDAIIKSNLLTQLEEQLEFVFSNNVFMSKNIHSLIMNKIPYYFYNKIEESNVVIGQQQLESYDQIINIYKNKNKEEKIETLKRNHIQKCIQWCEKNQLPHNKFIDKINIFLNTKKKENDNTDKDDISDKDVNILL